MPELKLRGGYRMEFKPGQKSFDANENWEPHWNVFNPDGRHVCRVPEYEAQAFATAMTRPDGGDSLREALEWYGEQARLCRLIHSGGDAGRHALANDGGNRAKAALAAKDGG